MPVHEKVGARFAEKDEYYRKLADQIIAEADELDSSAQFLKNRVADADKRKWAYPNLNARIWKRALVHLRRSVKALHKAIATLEEGA